MYVGAVGGRAVRVAWAWKVGRSWWFWDGWGGGPGRFVRRRVRGVIGFGFGIGWLGLGVVWVKERVDRTFCMVGIRFMPVAHLPVSGSM